MADRQRSSEKDYDHADHHYEKYQKVVGFNRNTGRHGADYAAFKLFYLI